MKKFIDFTEEYWRRKACYSTMIKPVGSLCNLQCRYCYYLDKKLQNGSTNKAMDLKTLQRYIKCYIQDNDSDHITFCWHGGEPLLAGLDFYRMAMEFQKIYSNGKIIENTLQTNGTLINNEWADFFAKENFLVGISIDGPEKVHNINRSNSFDKTIKGLECLKRASVEFNTLSALSMESSGLGKETYQFLKDIGSQYMQFLPVVEHVKKIKNYPTPVICNPEDPEGAIAPWSISSRDYGNFLIDVFDTWVKENDVGKIFVQIFDATLSRMCGYKAGVCSMNKECGDCLVVEHNGNVYSCDHFVYPSYKLGNITSDSLRDMYKSSLQSNFRKAKSSGLPEKCRKCIWQSLCSGECPKHRFATDGYVNYLCSGLQHYFRHSTPYFSILRDELLKKS